MRCSNVYVVLFILAISSNVCGQEFAPVGAKWHYTQHHAFSGDIDYLTIESVKDTVVDGMECRELHNGVLCGAYSQSQSFIYEDDSVVYFYDKLSNSFQVLYNFKARKGDSWMVKFNAAGAPDSLQVRVDSVYTSLINGKELIKQNISYYNGNVINWDSPNYRAEVTEIIGDEYYMFNLYSTQVVCDGNFSGGLRCYSDDYLGFYETGIADSCTYTYDYNWIGLNETGTDLFKIYPSFTKEQIHISTSYESAFIVRVSDLSGQIVFEDNLSKESVIDISHLPKGYYLVQLLDKGKVLGVKKIIKN